MDYEKVDTSDLFKGEQINEDNLALMKTAIEKLYGKRRLDGERDLRLEIINGASRFAEVSLERVGKNNIKLEVIEAISANTKFYNVFEIKLDKKIAFVEYHERFYVYDGKARKTGLMSFSITGDYPMDIGLSDVINSVNCECFKFLSIVVMDMFAPRKKNKLSKA